MPTINFFTVDNPTVAFGGTAVLSWSTTNADGIIANGPNGWTGEMASSGTFAVGPLFQPRMFHLTAYKRQGSSVNFASTTLQVQVAPQAPPPGHQILRCTVRWIMYFCGPGSNLQPTDGPNAPHVMLPRVFDIQDVELDEALRLINNSRNVMQGHDNLMSFRIRIIPTEFGPVE